MSKGMGKVQIREKGKEGADIIELLNYHFVHRGLLCGSTHQGHVLDI